MKKTVAFVMHIELALWGRDWGTSLGIGVGTKLSNPWRSKSKKRIPPRMVSPYRSEKKFKIIKSFFLA